MNDAIKQILTDFVNAEDQIVRNERDSKACPLCDGGGDYGSHNHHSYDCPLRQAAVAIGRWHHKWGVIIPKDKVGDSRYKEEPNAK